MCSLCGIVDFSFDSWVVDMGCYGNCGLVGKLGFVKIGVVVGNLFCG